MKPSLLVQRGNGKAHIGQQQKETEMPWTPVPRHKPKNRSSANHPSQRPERRCGPCHVREQAAVRTDDMYERRRQERAHGEVAQNAAEEYANKVALPGFCFAGNDEASD